MIEARDHLIAELLGENAELRGLAFGEIEHFKELARRWSRHRPPQDRNR